jgi:hypothetical protein
MNITIWYERYRAAVPATEFEVPQLVFLKLVPQDGLVPASCREDDLGVITCFATSVFQFELTIPVDIVGDEITLMSCNGTGIFNF